MLHVCIRKFDVMDTAQIFLETKRPLCMCPSEKKESVCVSVLLILSQTDPCPPLIAVFLQVFQQQKNRTMSKFVFFQLGLKTCERKLLK